MNHMRRMLISAAAVALLATPALVSSAWAQHDHPDHGNQAQGHQDQPQQGGGHDHGGDRGGNRGAAQPSAARAPAPPPQAANRGNGQGHRGAAQMAAPVAQPAPQDRGNRDHNNVQGQRGQNNGGNFNRSDNRPNNYQDNNRGNGNPRTAGQRRDFSSFREFHRDFNASRRFHAPAYRRPTGWYDHRWSFGEYLPRTYWVRDYWLDDFAAYGLPPPPYGAVWVRVGNDALLVDEDSGEVITVEYSVFY
jgi:Ni/Co efflux regulator RcnB